MRPEKVRENLEALIAEGEKVKRTRRAPSDDVYEYVNDEQSHQWTTNLMAMLRSVFGETSDHYKRAKKHEEKCYLYDRAVALLAIAKAALQAWDAGYVFEPWRRT